VNIKAAIFAFPLFSCTKNTADNNNNNNSNLLLPHQCLPLGAAALGAGDSVSLAFLAGGSASSIALRFLAVPRSSSSFSSNLLMFHNPTNEFYLIVMYKIQSLT